MDKKCSVMGLALTTIIVLTFPAFTRGQPMPCHQNGEITLWVSPFRPLPDQSLKIMAISTEAPLAKLTMKTPDDIVRNLDSISRGGPPWSLSGSFDLKQAGTYRIEARQKDQRVSCLEISVTPTQRKPSPWPAQGSSSQWDLPTEAFFAAWIEQLFDAPSEQAFSFPSLEPLLRDPNRNFLHNSLGMKEDERLPATPDCADLPYFLRAYFAWKLGLPISYRACSRGSAKTPPRCGNPTIETRFSKGTTMITDFKAVIRPLLDAVHSGSARTALSDEATDFYPIPLSRESLWPGTIYADPYGHVLLIAQWIPQTAEHAGKLWAVDAQPDHSVTRKRFWEGTFLFANQIPSAGPGFKSFRPFQLTGQAMQVSLRSSGRYSLPELPGSPDLPHPEREEIHPATSPASEHPTLLSNAKLTNGPRFSPYSDEQSSLSPDDFYARIGKLINPQGQDPVVAYEAMLDALVEQLETRIQSVENGAQYQRNNPKSLIPMPNGPAIFETVGPWEDYSTPSRDMRLIIALNVLERLPERIVLYPELFVMNGRSPEVFREELQILHSQRIQERQITYRRSDGSPWQLSLADIYTRKSALEVAYNPNDCVEARWGASLETPEYKTCQRRAPTDQRARMQQYRLWFRNAERPPR
jgi:hypothetical protein